MCVYIFAGRFQPFHNGHMEVLKELCKKINSTDFVVLGVIAHYELQDIKDKVFFEASKEHHLPERNPWELSVSLEAISSIARSGQFKQQIITTILPRPECAWEIIKVWFPTKRIWVIPMAGEDFDDQKSIFFNKMGDEVIRFPDTTGVSGRDLRDLYKKGQYEEFLANVPKGLADIYFKEESDNSAEIDFQKRAQEFESHSKWVSDEEICNVPRNFFQGKSIGNLLDAGGGTGYLSWYLYQNLKNKIEKISLVDISQNMLDEAKKKQNFSVLTHNSSIETFCKLTTQKFDTILVRQVLHYVEDVDEVVNLLKNVLEDNGIIYVGQILVENEETKKWHEELMKNISKNRKRTFVYENFIDLFVQSGFDILDIQLIDYEESFRELFARRISTYDIRVETIMSKMKAQVTKTLKDKMSIRFTENNIFFKVKFCHLFLQKKNDWR